ncbi:MAG: hypothetical protein FWD57_14360, partial [Polyangiaceae bacterium]|nr:hypothetical protein [Polyangiaceae bacterium]
MYTARSLPTPVPNVNPKPAVRLLQTGTNGENSIDIQAAECMGKLHDSLRDSNYSADALTMLLVRIMFCQFADHSGIFCPLGSFRFWIEQYTYEDGSDLGIRLTTLFEVLSTPTTNRNANTDMLTAAFPFIDHDLFGERLPNANFDRSTRKDLLDSCALDWASISPAIFGSLLQSAMDPQARRNLGVHYTTEANILELIQPLFLDSLRAEFECVRHSQARIVEFRGKLRSLVFFDPASGSGNFLVIALRELRLLEINLIRAATVEGTASVRNMPENLAVDIDQFYGIEIDGLAAQISRVALWLIDHQTKSRISAEFGEYYAPISIPRKPHIIHGNALTLDWNDILPANRPTYVFGNPPFIGAKHMNSKQREETRELFATIKSGGLLDYVAAWYIKAAQYVSNGSSSTQPKCELSHG